MFAWQKVKVSLLVFIIILIGISSGLVAETRNPTVDDYELVPSSNGFYPLTSWTGDPFVVRVPANTSLGMKLALCSLQGLVNRHVAQIYLDIEGPSNMSFLLPFLESEYRMRPTEIGVTEFLANFSGYARGLVVYDSTRLGTVNVATVVAGIEEYIIVDEFIAEQISTVSGLRVKMDLRLPPWAGLTDHELQVRSFEQYFARTNRTVLAIQTPERIGSRDYLIAAKVWTFYARQGPFASQEEIDFTERVMRSTPHNIPVFGWFETPTLVEENFFVQMASRYGKYILGGQDIPNLSYLTSIRPREPFVQDWHGYPHEPSEDGVYVSLVVPDGDNLDFVAGKMNELWEEWKDLRDESGSQVPVAWSINPHLAELAPPLLDYYYGPSASFIAAPSGAGYLYPGFTPAKDLKEYLWRTKRLMQETDMKVVWLLNSFKAYEIPYTEETLEQYVTALSPRGIVLDYADQAATRNIWMQKGDGAFAPIIRSTHLWSGRENLAGKIQAVVDAAPTHPHFFIIVVYPWTTNLTEAVSALGQIHGKHGGGVRIRSLDEMLGVILASFTSDATRIVEEARANPLAAIDFWNMREATDHLASMERHKTAQNYSSAAYEGYLASNHAKNAVSNGNLLLMVLVVLGFISCVEVIKRAKSKERKRKMAGFPAWVIPGLAISLVTYVFFAGLEKVLDYNFWLYAGVFVAGVVVHCAPRLQVRLEAVAPERSLSAEIVLLMASSLFLMWEPWAFVPLAGSAAMLLYRCLRNPQMRRSTTGVWFGFGLGGAILLPFDWWTICVSVTLLALMTSNLKAAPPATAGNQGRPKAKGVVFTATCLALVVVWTSLYRNRYFVEKSDVSIGLLQSLAIVLLVAAPVIALVAWKSSLRFRKFGALSTLTLSAVMWIVLWQVQYLTVFCLLLLATAVLTSWAAISAPGGSDWGRDDTAKFVSSLLILSTVVIVLIRMPAVVYSLYVVHLPMPVEYILYTPPLLMVFALADIVQTEALVRAMRRARRLRSAANAENGEK